MTRGQEEKRRRAGEEDHGVEGNNEQTTGHASETDGLYCTLRSDALPPTWAQRHVGPARSVPPTTTVNLSATSATRHHRQSDG